MRTFYEEECGWPVGVEPGAGRVSVTTGSALDALVMPEAMGRAVGHGLVAIMQPAVALASGRWWTFLTTPRPGRASLPDDLAGARVRMVPRGSPVALPLLQGGWALPPRSGRLPDHAVRGAAMTARDDQGTHELLERAVLAKHALEELLTPIAEDAVDADQALSLSAQLAELANGFTAVATADGEPFGWFSVEVAFPSPG